MAQQQVIPYADQPFVQEALAYVYVAQSVGRNRAGVLMYDCERYRSQIKTLSSQGDIQPTRYYQLDGLVTTETGTEKAQIIMQDKIINKSDFLRKELGEIPPQMKQFLRDIISSDELGLGDQGRQVQIDRNIGRYETSSSNQGSSFWCLLNNKEVRDQRDLFFQTLTSLKLMVRAFSYVSTRGGETREKLYVPAPELEIFFNHYLAEVGLGSYLWPEELEEIHSVFHILDSSNGSLSSRDELDRKTPVRFRDSVGEFIKECLARNVIEESKNDYSFAYLSVNDMVWYETERVKRYQKPLIDFLLVKKPIKPIVTPPTASISGTLPEGGHEAKGISKGEEKHTGSLAIFLGYSPQHEQIYWQPGKSNNGHLLIVGGSGAGKTELIRCIAKELVSHKFPVLMIDFHGDMSPDKTVVQTYDIHEASQYYFNPLEIDTKFPDITPLRAEYDFLDAMLINFPNLGIQQRDNIADIIEQGYKQQGITISPDTWSNELPFAFIQNEILNSDDKERQSLSAYFRGIFDYQLFSGTKKFSVGEVLNVGISHINLKLLPESLRALYADLFLRKLYYTLQTLGEIPRGDIPDNQRYRIFVIVDEAKLLVSERQGVKAVLNKYATEMRKCGVGLILASQLSHFNDEILANIASKICMNAENMNQAKTNGKLFDIPEKVLINLEPGQCYLKTKAGLTELQVSPSWKR